MIKREREQDRGLHGEGLGKPGDVCNTELGRIIRQKPTIWLPEVRSSFAGRQGPEIISNGIKQRQGKVN